ncbi:cation:proton antiporter [Pelagimonas varians]|uniref:K(+)/H(+) antiporter NhaP n=1 Tax=Pelagimonas varians TaxID=696760 RepID=A0A238K7J2_9RHOB|nr:sodium:proton antiporter [Pelagimonas varians]PYG31632.1 sodium/proton antiporter (CPA1 family) [Pelagimonas varians]SMX38891.1 K(+)/H(+) antiporter NhaP [Pelagimonas varians]
MAVSQTGGLDPVLALALIGVLGVGSQWLAWRLRLPAIVLMLAAGLLVGPGLGILNPEQQFGDMLRPMIGIAVAIILFEGGMVLNLHSLNDAAKGVRRLVIVGAPLGWAASAAVLHYVAGLGWASAAVFGGIMIVTGPTVIAPLLRQARLQKRPAALLQWEAIVNDPVGALAAVLAFEVVVVLNSATSAGHAVQQLVVGIGLASVLGVLGGYGIAKSFRRGWAPEYMKIPILFVVLIAVFAASDAVLHESGLLAVTIMGLWIANSDLPSYVELRRFKEHATVLLVSGVFILLSANMSRDTLAALDWRAGLFVLAVICIARPLPVLVALAFTNVPWRERALVAMTGPRGVVLVAVAGLFGERLAELGIEDGAQIAPLAFALVLATVVLHGFTLTPVARILGLTAGTAPGVLILGGSRWSVAFAQALEKLGLQVLLADPNHAHLRSAREAGVPVYYGDILSEAAEDRLDLVAFDMLISATDNDAYNTLVATDLAPEFGRSNVFQLRRVREKSTRHALPVTLGGRPFGADETFFELNAKIAEGWTFRSTNLTEEFSADDWRAEHPDAIPIAVVGKGGGLRLLGPDDKLRDVTGAQVLSFGPKRPDLPNGTDIDGEDG